MHKAYAHIFKELSAAVVTMVVNEVKAAPTPILFAKKLLSTKLEIGPDIAHRASKIMWHLPCEIQILYRQ